MSALAGLLAPDGAPVSDATLRTLAVKLARRAPGEVMVLNLGTVGFVYRASGALLVDKANTPSLWKGRNGAILAFDGYLHNASDLARRLEVAGPEARSHSHVLLTGLERFGPSFIGEIVGDFALAHWEPHTRRLTLSRDALGTRTLYYWASQKLCAFATDLGSLVNSLNVERRLDDEYVAGFLAESVPDPERTIYRSVKSVRPGAVLTVSSALALRETSVWSLPTDTQELTYRQDTEYEERLHHLFREAVNVRLCTQQPVAAELSGGVDSSSIVCMADHVLRATGATAPSLTTISRVLDRSLTFDEARFRLAVENHCQRPFIHVRETEVPNIRPADHVSTLHVLSPLFICSGFEAETCEHMRRLNAHVLLSGIGGDEMFYSTNAPLPGLADMWARWQLLRLHLELRRWSHAIKVPYLRLFWQSFEIGLRGRRRRLAGRPAFPSWLHPRLHEPVLARRAMQERRLKEYRLPSQRDHAAAFYSTVGIISTGQRQEFDARHVTFPCLHRPLVEFLQAVPFGQKLRCGESRSLQRRALREILPPEILKRRGKGNPFEAFMRELRANETSWMKLTVGSIAEAQEYVVVKPLTRTLASMCAGVATHDTPPFAALALELWLRTHCGGTHQVPQDWYATRAMVGANS